MGVDRLFTDRCRVTVRESAAGSDGLWRYNERTLYEDLPCRLRYRPLRSAGDSWGVTPGNRRNAPSDMASRLRLEAVIYAGPNTEIPPGSRIMVVKQERTLAFERSGEAGIYESHVEIPVISAKEWC